MCRTLDTPRNNIDNHEYERRIREAPGSGAEGRSRSYAPEDSSDAEAERLLFHWQERRHVRLRHRRAHKALAAHNLAPHGNPGQSRIGSGAKGRPLDVV